MVAQRGPAIWLHPPAAREDSLYGDYSLRPVGAEARRMHCPTHKLAHLIEPTGICLCTSAMRL